MRLRGTSIKELEEMGEDTEGAIEVVSKLEDKIYALSGVHVIGLNGELRSTYAIMADIAKVWDELDTNRQAGLLETIAGKNRSSDVAALLGRWDAVEQAMQAATEAEGSIAKGQDIYIDSLQGKLNTLKATWQSFSANFMDSSFLAFFVDLGTSALSAIDGINSLISAIGGLPTVLMAVGTALLFVKDGIVVLNAAQKAVIALKAIGGIFSSIIHPIQTFKNMLSTAGVAWSSFIASGTGGMAALSSSLQILGVIAGAITAVVAITNAYNNSKKQQRQEAMAAGDSAKEEASSIIGLYNAYQNAKSAYDSNTGSKEELDSATNSLLSALGYEASQVDALTAKYGGLDEAIQKVTQDSLEQKIKEMSNAYEAAKTEAVNIAKGAWYSSGLSSVSFQRFGTDATLIDVASKAGYQFPLANGMYDFNSVLEIGNGKIEDFDDVIAAYEDVVKLQQVLKDGMVDYGYTWEQLISSNAWISLEASLGSIKEAYENVFSYMDSANEGIFNQQISELGTDIIPKTVSEFKNFRDEMIRTAVESGNFLGTQTDIERSFDNTISKMSGFSSIYQTYEKTMAIIDKYSIGKQQEEINSFTDWISNLSLDDLSIVLEVGINTENADWSIEKWEEELENYRNQKPVEIVDESKLNGVAKSLKSLSDGYKVVDQYQKDVEDGLGLTADLIQSMSSYLDEGEDIGMYLRINEETKALELDVEAWNNRSNAMKDSDVSVIDAQIAKLQEENELLEKSASNRQEIADQMKEYQIGNVDLTVRPVVSQLDMKKAGWDIGDKAFTTLYSQTFSAGKGIGYDFEYDQNVVFNITPITKDGEKLTPQALQEYIDQLLQSEDIMSADAVANGGKGIVLKVSAVEDGSVKDAVQSMNTWAESLQTLQDQYYQVEGNNVAIQSLEELKNVYISLSKTIGSEKIDLVSMFDGLEDIGSRTKNLRDALNQLSDGTALSINELEALASEYPDLMQVDDFLNMTDVESQQTALQNVYKSFTDSFNTLVDTQILLLNAAKAEMDATEDTSTIDAMISNLEAIKNIGIEGIVDENGTKSVVSQYDLVADAISGVKKASDTLTEINASDRDILSIFSNITDMAKQSGQSITDFVEVVDGKISFKGDAITNWATNLVNKLDEIPGMTDEIKNSFIDEIKAEEDAIKAYEDLDDAIGRVTKSNSVLQDIMEFKTDGEGDILSIMSEIVSMAEKSGQDVSDFVNVVNGELVFNEGTVKEWSNTFIDSLDIDSELKSFLKGKVGAIKEATEEVKGFTDYLSEAESLLSTGSKNAGKDMSLFDSISAAAHLSKDSGKDIMNFLNEDMTLNDASLKRRYMDVVTSITYSMNMITSERDKFITRASEAWDEAVSAEEDGLQRYNDALSKFDKYYSITSKLSSDEGYSAFDKFSDVIELAKMTGQSIEELWDYNASDIKQSGLIEALSIIESSYKEIDEITGEPLFSDSVIENLRKYAEEAHKAAQETKSLDDILGEAESLASIKRDALSGDMSVLDVYSNASKLAKISGRDASLYITKDNQLNLAQIEADYGNKVISYANQFGLVGEQRKSFLADSVEFWNNLVEAEKTGIEKLKDVSSELSGIYSDLDSLKSGKYDKLDMFTKVVELADKYEGVNLSDLFDFERMDFNLEGFNGAIDVVINGFKDLKDSAGNLIIPTDQFDDWAEWVKKSFEKSPAEIFKENISNINSATDLIQKATSEFDEIGRNSIDTLQSLIELYGDEWEKFATFGEDGKLTVDTEKIKADVFKQIEDMDIDANKKAALKIEFQTEFEIGNLKESVDSYISNIDSLYESRTKLKNGEFTSRDRYELIAEYPELAKYKDLLSGVNAEIKKIDGKAMKSFYDALTNAPTEEARSQVTDLMQAYSDLRSEMDEPIVMNIETITDGFENVSSAIKEANSETGLSSESMSNLIERYQELEDFNIADLFERSAMGIKLNTEAMNELESAYQEQVKSKLGDTIDDLVKQYEDLEEQIKNTTDATELMDLYDQRDSVLNRLNDAANLMSQYEALTSAYNKWKAAQSGGEQGDMYDDVQSGLKKVADLYDKGLIGTEEFQAGLAFMTGIENVSEMTPKAIAEAFEEAYPRVSKFFEDGTKGCENFLNTLQEFGYATKDGDNWEIGEFNVEEAASDLEISVDLIYAMMGKLKDYGFKIEFTSDDAIVNLENCVEKAELADATLKKIDGNTYSFDFNATNIERLDEQIEQAETLLKQFYKTNENGESVIDLSIAGAEEAQYILATLIHQKQEATKPLVMKIETTNLSGDIGQIIRDAQAVLTARNKVEIQAEIGADTKDAQSELNKAISKLQQNKPEILAQLGIDNTSEQSLIDSISKIDAPILAKVGIDEESLTQLTSDALIESTVHYTVDAENVRDFENDEHSTDGTVIWGNNVNAVNSYSRTKKTANGVVTWENNTSNVMTHFEATGTIKWSNSGGQEPLTTGSGVGAAQGTAHVSGTAFASGTAFKSGNWGVKGSGVALSGELGTELIVRKGRYFTIGDNGAEFFHYQKDDIIFNAEQTKELFEKGKVTSGGGRGRAFAQGTAFASGSYSGGGSFYVPKKGITSSSSASGKSASGTGNANPQVEEEEREKVDWIEIAIERVEVAIETLANVAENAYRTLTDRMNATADEIQEVTDEITLQQRAYDRYMREANAVPLDNRLKELVKTGAIDITEYSKETQELISEYEEWYSKAMDCSAAIEELHATLAELYTSRFEMVQKDAEAQISLLEHMTNTFSKSIDMIETKGYLGGKMLYKEMADIQTDMIKKYNDEISDLQLLMSEAVGSGEMDIGSEEYYEMQKAINDVKESLFDAQIAFEEYNNSMRQMDWDVFDYLEERIKTIVDESNFLIELIGDTDLFDDNGAFSERGTAVLGLRAVNYNTYMSQADQYAKEIGKINDEILSGSLDTQLIKRREELLNLQRESILAAESEKTAIQELVNDGISVELKALKELINEYTNSLEVEENLYNYRKKTEKQTKEIISLQKQLAAYQNDVSEENKARIQKLQVELVNAQDELSEAQYNQYIKDMKQLLNNLYDDYEQSLNNRVDDIDYLISMMIDEVNANSSEIMASIEEVGNNVGYTITDSMKEIWSSQSDTVAVYSKQFSEQMTTIQTTIANIKGLVDRLVKVGEDTARQVIASTTPTTDVLDVGNPFPATEVPMNQYYNDFFSSMQSFFNNQNAAQNSSSGGGGGNSSSSGSKKSSSNKKSTTTEKAAEPVYTLTTAIVNKPQQVLDKKVEKIMLDNADKDLLKKALGFSQGGIVGDYRKIAQKNGDDMITINTLKKGEAVLTPYQNILFQKFAGKLPQLQGIFDTSTVLEEILSDNGSKNVSQIQYNVGGISFPIDHVSDYNDLVAQMQRDSRFEKFIQSMTVDRIVGGSKFAKYKQRFDRE